MQKERAIKILNNQKDAAKKLNSSRNDISQLKKWKRDTLIAIKMIFGPDSPNISDFLDIKYSRTAFSSLTSDSEFQKAYEQGLKNADAILSSMIEEIQNYGFGECENANSIDSLAIVERICIKFNAFVRQMQNRREKRPPITVDDEYDVQDVVHALLRIHFDDVRAEEWVPSYAGKSSRLDFLLKKERIVIEVKKTRDSMKTGELGEQLIIDRARYEKHPDCDILVCFVYDPDGRVNNPFGLERDLEGGGGRLKVRVIVAPKS